MSFAAPLNVRDSAILFAIGSDEERRTPDGRPAFEGCTDLHKLLGRDQPVHRMHVRRQMLRHARRPELDGYSHILNLVTDPDQNPQVLDTLKKLLRGYRGKVLNRPEAVLRTGRDQVARRLDGLPGLVVPRTMRVRGDRAHIAVDAVARSGLAYPLIVRQAGMHTGRTMALVTDPADLEEAVRGPGERIITEFVDFRSADGLYRKYRIFCIGGTIIFRHLLVSDDWNVHARDRMRFMAERPALLAEEQELFDRADAPFSASAMGVLAAVAERMELDYFGMDFGQLPDGRLVLFEANPTMNFFPFLSDERFAYVQACLTPARAAFYRMLGLGEAASPQAAGASG